MVTHCLAFPLHVHFSGYHDVLLPISESMLSCILVCTLLKHILFPLGGNLALLLLWALLKIHALAILLQKVSWPDY